RGVQGGTNPHLAAPKSYPRQFDQGGDAAPLVGLVLCQHHQAVRRAKRALQGADEGFGGNAGRGPTAPRAVIDGDACHLVLLGAGFPITGAGRLTACRMTYRPLVARAPALMGIRLGICKIRMLGLMRSYLSSNRFGRDAEQSLSLVHGADRETWYGRRRG